MIIRGGTNYPISYPKNKRSCFLLKSERLRLCSIRLSLELDIYNHGFAVLEVAGAGGFGFNSHSTLMIFHSPLNLATER